MEGHKQDKRRLGSPRLRISQGTDQAHFSRHLPGQGSTGIQKAPLPSKLHKYPNKATVAAWSSPAEALQLVQQEYCVLQAGDDWSREGPECVP